MNGQAGSAGFTATTRLSSGSRRFTDVRAAAGERLATVPWVLRMLLENALREAGADEARAALDAILTHGGRGADIEIPFRPRRILMHDTTCGPALVDIAAMRDVIAENGGDPASLSPICPVATSTDHSVGVDRFGTSAALAENMAIEVGRNAERYRFMKWAAASLGNFRVFPPGTGIMHTINMEHLTPVVAFDRLGGEDWIVPDTLLGTDSHTPMINSLGVLGWGVGGLEAEGAMFGLPLALRLPEVVGVRLTGALGPGRLGTDVALTVTERLRKLGVVGKFVEFYGPGVAALSVGERGAIANMAPEYGATTGFFPIDARTLDYLRATGRDHGQLPDLETYARHQGFWHDPGETPRYAAVLDLDLAEVGLSLAGPKRPQDRLEPARAPLAMRDPAEAEDDLITDVGRDARPEAETEPLAGGLAGGLRDGALAIAAITSCTNTTDPKMLLVAGLVARAARARGLAPPPWVKTSLGPGSRAAARYLERLGLMDDLEALGFGIVGFGCTTCIGNSGPLVPEMAEAIETRGITAAAVLSGNRNFPGRVHGQIEHAFLASPPLVVAYGIAGTVDCDITREPLGRDPEGAPVFLRDIWPSDEQVEAAHAEAVTAEDFSGAYADNSGGDVWAELDAPTAPRFPWDPASTYLRRPPFVALPSRPAGPTDLAARPLIALGDDINTDHISPAGAIPAKGEAGAWLIERGENPRDLNVFSSRRGNFEAMVRGLFTNRSVRNLLVPEAAPGFTRHAPSGELLPLYRAAERYREEGTPTVILAGQQYGAGSSRDWGAKGPALLGARAVLARSFERIHRSNLIGMGILPLELPEGSHPASLALRPEDTIAFTIDYGALMPGMVVPVTIRRASGEVIELVTRLLIETSLDARMLAAGGLIPLVLERHLAEHGPGPVTELGGDAEIGEAPGTGAIVQN
ncbi:aconitate hydratase AcnA [Amaricoccus sp. W119]|uniref:aconitate hydratase AcnA n=1 Tax=Amaricoccus sp. W119 TaxID=3391833 RepID=UPI0039A657C5